MPADPSIDLDLNLLVALEALLSESNVTRAAKRVGLTQSAMSHKLRRLRDLFGDPLLVGGRSGMVPTPRAQAMLGQLRRSLSELRGIYLGARPFDPTTSDRAFVVVSSDYAEFGILAQVIEHTSRHAASTSLRMREPWPGMVQALEDGSADLHVGGPLVPQAGLIQRKIIEDRWVCLVAHDNPEVGPQLDLETYTRVHHLIIDAGYHVAESPIDRALEDLGTQRTIVLRIPHVLGGPFIVARSRLIMTAGAAWAFEAAARLPLRILPLPFDVPPFPVYMTWHDRFTRDPGHIWLRELAERCTVEIIGATARARDDLLGVSGLATDQDARRRLARAGNRPA